MLIFGQGIPNRLFWLLLKGSDRIRPTRSRAQDATNHGLWKQHWHRPGNKCSLRTFRKSWRTNGLPLIVSTLWSDLYDEPRKLCSIRYWAEQAPFRKYSTRLRNQSCQQNSVNPGNVTHISQDPSNYNMKKRDDYPLIVNCAAWPRTDAYEWVWPCILHGHPVRSTELHLLSWSNGQVFE
jgi:hypothetical protein